ncbi:MAG TPA: hypothetical protein VLF20_01470 [Patescibacteria group bacterium]|nr:hypothetical protein [Patescibacteria group bacterium]
MTLHQTIDISRKILMYVGIGVGVAFTIYLIFQLGVIIKNTIAPPPTEPPTVTYGKVQPIIFPENKTKQKLSFTVNTLSGALPLFPDRIALFKVEEPQPNFLNLSKAQEKAGQLRFVDQEGELLPETKIDNSIYHWQERTGLQRKFTIDIVTFHFDLESNFTTRTTEKHFPMSDTDAITKVTNLLSVVSLTPTDVDLEQTKNPDEERHFRTKPQRFRIDNGKLLPVDVLSETQVLRVDLYQKDITYALDTGLPSPVGGTTKEPIEIPVVYPNPPYSTMSFWVGSGESDTQVVAAHFFYYKPLIEEEEQATYPLKTAEEAFTELMDGKGYIASYFGTETNIAINNVFLAYYLGDQPHSYLMPVIVFEGTNGFFAYVSALREDWIETQPQE